jgi:hypothetical protein
MCRLNSLICNDSELCMCIHIVRWKMLIGGFITAFEVTLMYIYTSQSCA